MSKIVKKMKIMQPGGTLSDYVPIGAEAENINVDGESVETKLGKKPYYYDTVADMKADTKLKAEDMAVTLGYYSVNDGGGAEYKIVVEESEDEYQEDLTNGLYASLIIEDYVKPEQLGAYGDNIHDDTTAIQATLNKYKCVRFSKEYKISEITINNKDIQAYGAKFYGQVNIECDVNLNGGEYHNEAENGICLKCYSTRASNQGRMNTYINNVQVYPNTSSGIGIKLLSDTNALFDLYVSNSEIFSCETSINIQSDKWITKCDFENIFCHSPSYVIKAINNTNNVINLSDITFRNVFAQYYNQKPINFLNIPEAGAYITLENSFCYDGIKDWIIFTESTNSRVTMINDNNGSLIGDKVCNKLDSNVMTIPRYNDGSTILKANQAMSQKWMTNQYGTIVPMASGLLGVTGAPFLGFVAKAGSYIGSSTPYSMLSFNNGRLVVGYNFDYAISSFKKYEVTTPMAGQIFTSDNLPAAADGRRNGATCWCSDLKMTLTYYEGHWYKPDGTQFS